jgi:hypothetical protein
MSTSSQFEMKMQVMSRRVFGALALGTTFCLSASPYVGAAEGVDPVKYQQVVDGGIEYLKSQVDAESGALSKQSGLGVSSLCTAAILAHRPSAVNDPVVKKLLGFIESNIRPDGGIYSESSTHKNYETCLAIVALNKANETGRYDAVLKKAEAFAKGLQWDEGEGIESSDPAYGGAGYGSHKRPDLSNTSFMLDALKELGRGPEDEAIQKALIFVSRTQNLESPANDTGNAEKVNDGGFYYTPANGGESQAGVNPDGGLRSYGSMTYAGLKSMLYAGVNKDDPRVKAAMDFISKHYSLEQNPGMGAAGLYYYYHTFAKALDATGLETLSDASGTEHNWRGDLFSQLASEQSENGSWVNDENPRWLEGDRSLVTGYALLALAYCKPTSAGSK